VCVCVCVCAESQKGVTAHRAPLVLINVREEGESLHWSPLPPAPSSEENDVNLGRPYILNCTQLSC